MQRVKEIANNPEQFEISVKQNWADIDVNNEGSVPYEVFREKGLQILAKKGLPFKELNQEQKAGVHKLVDPQNTGRVTIDGFRALMKAGIAKAKASGNI